MAEQKNKLDAQVRENFGKGAARKLRAAGQTRQCSTDTTLTRSTWQLMRTR